MYFDYFCFLSKNNFTRNRRVCISCIFTRKIKICQIGIESRKKKIHRKQVFFGYLAEHYYNALSVSSRVLVRERERESKTQD